MVSRLGKLARWCSRHLGLLGLATLTLGLAPFKPEPHLWQKLKWLAQGAAGMTAIDWFDLFLHGTPWLLLALGLLFRAFRQMQAASTRNTPKNP